MIINNADSLINNSNQAILDFALHLADTNLILAQRLAAWCGHGPVLEQDIAITNITLDLLGQSQYYFELASNLDPKGRNEDQLAMTRPEIEYKNLLLVELPNGNFADTIMRQFIYDTYHLLLLDTLKSSTYTPLVSIAEKAWKEVHYHVNWSSTWILRLGDGTEESHQKIQTAFENIWPYALEAFEPAEYQNKLSSMDVLSIDWKELKDTFLRTIEKVLSKATLFEACQRVKKDADNPEIAFFHKGGKQGRHTEYMGYILTELQYMQKNYPGMEW